MSAAPVIAGGLLVAYLTRSSRPSDGPPAAPESFSEGWVQGIRVQLRLVLIDGKGHQLRDTAALAWQSLYFAALGAGVQLQVNSAFRTMAQQQKLYDAYLLFKSGKGPAAPIAAAPGHSNHQAGLAVDVDVDNGNNAAFRWLTVNAGAYGFARTVASEPWHWEFV